jgi:hypothetical protein
MKNYLRVGALVKMTGASRRFWRDPNVVLRVAKRKKAYGGFYGTYEYFVVALGDPVGHGTWAGAAKLRALNALELLAHAADDN